jgi:hypothetical protein
MFLLQFSYFSAVDQILLDWLPLIVGFVLTIWLFAELNNTPPASETFDQGRFGGGADCWRTSKALLMLEIICDITTIWRKNR